MKKRREEKKKKVKKREEKEIKCDELQNGFHCTED